MIGFQSETESPLISRLSVKRVRDGVADRVVDLVPVEEPLAIFLTYWSKEKRVTENLAVTMRTPGHDLELAAGYLYGEGVVRYKEDIVDTQNVGGSSSGEIRLELRPAVDVDAWRLARTSLTASACGICGKRLFDTSQQIEPQPDDGFRIEARLITELPGLLRAQQLGFAHTGGLHAAGLISEYGCVESVFEDVGRHNALDKLIGEALLKDRVPLSRKVLFLSSRGSYELVQKAAAACCPVLATVGSPSSLAVEAARRWGITLLGFVRDGRFNIYAGDWRVTL